MASADIPSQCLTFKYRLLLRRRQHAALQKILDDQRFLYNSALAERIDAYRKAGKSISYIDQCRSLTEVRRDMPGWAAYPANMQRGTLRRLDEAFKGFFVRVKRGELPGFPRFKGKNRFSSFSFTEFSGLTFDGKRIRFRGLPGGLRVHLHRPLPQGKILTAKFKRDAKGWCVCFVMRMSCAGARIGNRAVGVDVGISVLAMLSTGEAIPNPKMARSSEKAMRRAQRALARCKRGSKRRKKVRKRLTGLHQRIANARRTHLHQISARIVREYDVIAVEKLQIKNMMKNPHLARSISDAAWGKLVEILRYKAAKAGARLVEVDPRNTSQACSGCGVIVLKKIVGTLAPLS